MRAGDGFLDGLRREMRQSTGLDAREVASRLFEHLAADRDRLEAPIADLFLWPTSVEIALKTGALWMVECLAADAYHVFPGHVREDGDVAWPNIWVAPDMTLDQAIGQITRQVFGNDGAEQNASNA